MLAIATLALAACSPEPNAEASSATQSETTGVRQDAPRSAPIVCTSCGIVRSVTPITSQGNATGAGVVLGGIVGGVAGNQVGGGDGKKLATVAGVIGGAVLGNKIEKDRNGVSYYEVSVDMEAGGQRIITIPNAQGITPGTAVMVNGNDISLR